MDFAFQTLRTDDFRGLGALTWELHPRLNLVVAPNGTGKTSLVAALRAVLDAHLPPEFALSAPSITGMDFYQSWSSDNVEGEPRRSLRLEGQVQGFPLGLVARIPKTASPRLASPDVKGLVEVPTTRLALTEAAISANAPLPMWAVVSADRNPPPGTPPDLPPPPNDAIDEADPILRSRMGAALDLRWWPLRDRWFLSEAFEDSGERARNTMSSIRAVFSRAFGEEAQPTFNADALDVMVTLPEDGPRVVHLMSDGWRGMVSLIVALSFRASRLNPRADDAGAVTPGALIIDEVEQHLHPSLQLTFLGALRRAFPRLQIIATTHSPLVLAEASGLIEDDGGGQIFRLDRVGPDQVAIAPLDPASGRSVLGITTGPWFGLERTFDPHTETLLAKHRASVRSGDIDTRRDLEQQLRSRLGRFAETSTEEMVISIVAELEALPAFEQLDHAGRKSLRDRTLALIRAGLP